MYTDSRIAQNFRYLGISMWILYSEFTKLTCTDISNRVYDERKARVKEANVRIAIQVIDWMNGC